MAMQLAGANNNLSKMIEHPERTERGVDVNDGNVQETEHFETQRKRGGGVESFCKQGKKPLEIDRCQKEQGGMQASARGTRQLSDGIGRSDEHLATPQLDRQEQDRTKRHSRIPKAGPLRRTSGQSPVIRHSSKRQLSRLTAPKVRQHCRAQVVKHWMRGRSQGSCHTLSDVLAGRYRV